MSENPHSTPAAARRRKRRHARERRFRMIGAAGIFAALAALLLLLGSILLRGLPAFTQHEVNLELDFANAFGGGPAISADDAEALQSADYGAIVKHSLRRLFPDVQSRRERRQLNALLSRGAAFELRDRVLANPALVQARPVLRLPLSDDADLFLREGGASRARPESERRLSDAQIAWLDALTVDGRIERVFAWRFLSRGDSREPELAGLWGAVLGSFWTLLVTLLIAFPSGVAAAIYLEEFAPKNRWTDLIEVNINNLAAVPSIVFGLLGLALFLNFLQLPRSAPLVGGMVLSLMTLPTVIVAARAAIAAVPPAVREAALSVGASLPQMVFHHVLPLALPGILTGTIIGMARALGETAPLLMIGMVAFIADLPSGPTAPSSALPVQIYLWADSPERAFVAKTSAAILVLLSFLMAMNLAAVLLRNRFERRW